MNTVRCSVLLLWTIGACRYSLDPDVDPNRDGGGFTCASDSDCGAGWHCNLACDAAGFEPYCLPDSECDPCPDLETDKQNCGSCGNACGTNEICISSSCVAPPT
jgi:hypothetical protein